MKMRMLAVVLITSIFAFLSFGNNCIQADELTQGNIFGEQVSDPTEYNKRIDEFIQKYSLDFMRSSTGSAGVNISDCKRMYDIKNTLTGFLVTFTDRGKDSGYVLISLLTEDSPIVEFSLDGSFPVTLYGSELIYTGPDQLYVSNTRGYFSVADNEIVQRREIEDQYQRYIDSQPEIESRINQMRSNAYPSIYDGIIDWNKSSLNTSSVFKIAQFGQGEDYWLMKELDVPGNSVCAPTAGTNVLWYWGFKRNSTSVSGKVQGISGNQNKAKKIFGTLKSGMLTNNSGGTWDPLVLNGYQKYFQTIPQQGGIWNYRYITYSNGYSAFVNALKDNCPIHLMLRFDDNSWARNMHDVFAIGYANSTSGTQYLLVMDGWNNHGRFVKYSYYGGIKGYKIWVRG